ncbi:hypothetical protein FNV43_RR19199 [Rhamnella rubrinervis]|uniref:Uncharacterized protein n=1 Tax=Rhamnella rubrinervis TaxID=2594499 RepID=A0A8K0E6L0_9ROSA|nr:hypothetical protein FNV43_RR19199 [Rhamnella rubrinervis]
MDQQEKPESTNSASAIPILPRVDRLDVLLQFLEEKQSLPMSARHSWSPVLRNMKLENQYKTLSSAIEEVHHKGTLLERVAMLENRVLQLCQEMDVGNASGSSSSTIVVAENIGPESESPPVKRPDESVTVNFNLGVKDNEEACCASQEKSEFSEGSTARKEPVQGCRRGRGQKRSSAPNHHRGWFTWLRLGC